MEKVDWGFPQSTANANLISKSDMLVLLQIFFKGLFQSIL